MGSAEASAAGEVVVVQVAFSPAPGTVDLAAVKLHAGATLADALRASGLAERHGWVIDEHLGVGIWGKPRLLSTPLREGDRVEVYRGLLVDPKEARRQRYRKQPPKRRSAAAKG